jgi:hypothetical protein
MTAAKNIELRLDLAHAANHPFDYESLVTDAERLVARRADDTGCRDAKAARKAVKLLRELWEQFKLDHDLFYVVPEERGGHLP